MNSIEPFNYILLKLASRCNINCSYCYWFRDQSVYTKPSLLTKEVENAFLLKLKAHIVKFKLTNYQILFHGGEPTLFGKQRFFDICKKIKTIESQTECKISLSITTNGILVDEEWAALFSHYSIGVTISLDGPEEVHDQNRKDFKNSGTYAKVVESIKLLNNFKINLGFLAVANLNHDPSVLFDHFVNELNIKQFDILIPDATNDDATIPSISSYYIKLFEIWYNHPNRPDIEIRVLRSIILGLMSFTSSSEGLGYGSITTNTLLTDGSIEPLDVLRIAGTGSTRSDINVLTHDLQDVARVQIWQEAFHASTNLPEQCQNCEYKYACGGGYLPHRWSIVNRFNNPSVYCVDLKRIFAHVADTLLSEVSISLKE